MKFDLEIGLKLIIDNELLLVYYSSIKYFYNLSLFFLGG